MSDRYSALPSLIPEPRGKHIIRRVSDIEVLGPCQQGFETQAAVGGPKDIGEFPSVRFETLEKLVAGAVEILPEQIGDDARSVRPPIESLEGLSIRRPRGGSD